MQLTLHLPDFSIERILGEHHHLWDVWSHSAGSRTGDYGPAGGPDVSYAHAMQHRIWIVESQIVRDISYRRYSTWRFQIYSKTPVSCSSSH